MPIAHLVHAGRVAAAQQALDARNQRWRERRKPDVKEDNRAVADRLEAAEKAVNKFVAKRLQPAVQRVPPACVVTGAPQRQIHAWRGTTLCMPGTPV